MAKQWQYFCSYSEETALNQTGWYVICVLSQYIGRLLFSTVCSLNSLPQLCYYNYSSCWRKTDQLSQIMQGVFLPCWSLNWPVLGSTACFLREDCSWQSFLRAERNSSSFLHAWTVLKATWRVTDGLATAQWAELRGALTSRIFATQ